MIFVKENVLRIHILMHSEIGFPVKSFQLSSFCFQFSKSGSKPRCRESKRNCPGFQWSKVIKEVMKIKIIVREQFIRGRKTVDTGKASDARR